jgi:nucleoside-diphosphate-sugar epimerase
MPDHVLITGGAGFIGSHLVDELIRHGHGQTATNWTGEAHAELAARGLIL